jgi:hypothetical protein
MDQDPECGVHLERSCMTPRDSNGVWLAESTSVGYRYIHRHWDQRATASVYVNREGSWAECTMCRAMLHVPKPRSR